MHPTAFTVHRVRWTAFVRLPQLSGVDGIAHVRVQLYLVALRMTVFLIQSYGARVVVGHGGGGLVVLRGGLRRWRRTSFAYLTFYVPLQLS